MSQLMYKASARTYAHNLKNLSANLRTAAREARVRGIDTGVLVNARLAPDMLPLSSQVQIACDNAKGACARLAGVELPSHPDEETNFDELQQRIRDTRAFLRTIKVAQYAGSEDREILIETPVGTITASGADYLFGWSLPNFWFHITTAYAILRHNGVPLGKADFLGPAPGISATGEAARVLRLTKSKKPRTRG